MQPDLSLVESVATNVGRLALLTPTLAPATDTNTYFITHEKDVLLVEPATPFAEERSKLESAILSLNLQGKRLIGAVLTHHHGDHIGAASWLTQTFGVPIWAHPITAERLRGRVEIDRVLTEGESLLDGTVELLHTPGHAPGHLCLRSPTHGWMIVGDMVASVGTIVIDPDDQGDMRVYLEQLHRIAALDPTVLLPAHGAPVLQPQELLAFYQAHRLKREARVYDALVSGGMCTLDEVVRLAYADTPKELWPIAAKSALAHLNKLCYDGRVRWFGDIWTDNWKAVAT